MRGLWNISMVIEVERGRLSIPTKYRDMEFALGERKKSRRQMRKEDRRVV